MNIDIFNYLLSLPSPFFYTHAIQQLQIDRLSLFLSQIKRLCQDRSY